ncbi:MAG: permease-like cell division protein FtsX [Oscillospiraceae bacterium]|nr:permease-like cell division protein FtsX [Oscillospiraceae bacterium]
MFYLIGQGFRNIWKNRVMGMASVCVLMVSLLLVGVCVLFVMNVEILLDAIENKNEIVVFLKDEVTVEEVPEIEDTLKSMGNVSSAVYCSKEQALDNYINQMEGYEDIFESLKTDNPLPDSFNVKIADTTQLTQTVDQINAMSFTQSIQAPTDFVEVLNKLKKVVSLISIAVLSVLIVVSLIMISNTTRASVYARRREINIMKYVGATNSFIRVPFFFEGLFTGFIAGVGASAVTYFGYTKLMNIITNDISFWEVIGVAEPLPFDNEVRIFVISLYLCIGAVIGALGSVSSTTKHLQV